MKDLQAWGKIFWSVDFQCFWGISLSATQINSTRWEVLASAWGGPQCSLSFVTSTLREPYTTVLKASYRNLDQLYHKSRSIITSNLRLTPSCSRLARRGGVKRISAHIYDETRKVLKDHLTMVCLLDSSAIRNLLTLPDIEGLCRVYRAPKKKDRYCYRCKASLKPPLSPLPFSTLLMFCRSSSL